MGAPKSAPLYTEIEPFRYLETPATEPPAVETERFAELHAQGEDAADPNLTGKRNGSSVKRWPDTGPPSSSPELVEETGAEQRNRQAAEIQQAEERGFGNGVGIGRASGREEAATHLQAERSRLHAQAQALIESFATQRDAYLHQLEQESVQLALAIAAHILRREAQVDPLLVTGAVRVALRELPESTEVRLRVPEQDRLMWEEALQSIPRLALRPQVIGDAGMELGDCRMETELGSADLGLWPQLKEIERGFFARAGEPSIAAPRNSDEPEIGPAVSAPVGAENILEFPSVAQELPA